MQPVLWGAIWEKKDMALQMCIRDRNYNTDIYCRMYRSVEELLAYARQTEPKVYRPFIMTEYLHAMEMCIRDRYVRTLTGKSNILI